MPETKDRWASEIERLKKLLGVRRTPPTPDTTPEDHGEVRDKLAKQNQRLRLVSQQVQREEEALKELHAKLTQARKEAFSQNLLGNGAPVFFLTGRAKSGTSWLMRILDSHPEVLCKGEGRFFGRDYMRENNDKTRTRPRLRTLHGAMADSEDLRAWIERSVWTQGDDVEEHLANITGLSVDYFLQRRLLETNKKIVGDKTPFTGVDLVDEIVTIYPNARLIHIMRDGRDVAISAIHHIWNHAKHEGGLHELAPEELAIREAYRSDPQAFMESGESIFFGKRLAGTARDWAEAVRRTAEDGPRLLGENYAEVRYEDLLERPEQEIRRLLEFLGADAGEQVVRRCVESASFENWAKGRQRGQEEPTAFLRKGVAGEWESVYTAEDRRIFKEAAGDALIEFGYEKDYDW